MENKIYNYYRFFGWSIIAVVFAFLVNNILQLSFSFQSIFSVDNKIHKKYAIALDDAVILSDIIIKQTKEYIENLMNQSKINTTTK